MTRQEILHCLCSWTLGWAMLIDGTLRVLSLGTMRPGLGYALSLWLTETRPFSDLDG